MSFTICVCTAIKKKEKKGCVDDEDNDIMVNKGCMCMNVTKTLLNKIQNCVVDNTKFFVVSVTGCFVC